MTEDLCRLELLDLTSRKSSQYTYWEYYRRVKWSYFLRFHPRFSSKSSKNMVLGVILAALSCGGIHFAPSPGGEATDAKFGCFRNRISTHRPRACGFRHLTSSKVGALVPMVCLASPHEALLKNASCGC